MVANRKKILIDLVFGIVLAIAAMYALDLFQVQTKRDTFRILSDCFFLPAAILLASAGLTWTANGGVWDGLGFTIKILFARMLPDYDSKRVTFAEYKEKREEKNSTPIPSLVAGLVFLALALLFLVLFNTTN